MLDVRFFENPRFTAASGAITLTFFTLFGTLFLLTQYLQSVLGYSPLKAGAILLPQAGVMMIVAPSSSAFVRRWGNKIVVSVGLAIVAATLVLMAFLAVNATVWEVIAVTVLLGVGMGNVMAPATDSIMGSLPREKAGVGSAMNDTTRQTGGAAGVAVLGSILASRYASSVTHAAQAGRVPASLLADVKANVGQAVAIANSPQAGRFGASIGSVAREAYVSAFHAAALIGAVIMVLTTIGVAIWLPARPRDEDDQPVVVVAAAPAGMEMAPPELEPAYGA
jgi:Na+/melibiose symporter-like transporter